MTISVFATEILVAGLIVLAACDREFRARTVALAGRRALASILALLAFAAISISWACDRDIAAQKVTLLVFSLSAFLLFLGSWDRRKTVFPFLASAVMQSAIGIAQTVHNLSPASTLIGIAEHSAFSGGASVVEWAEGRLLRAYGTMPHPNVLGGMLAIASLVAVAEYARTKSSRIRIVLLATLAFTSLGLFLTFSRGAWLAFVIGLVPLALVYARSKDRGRHWLAMAFVPAAVAALVLLPAVMGRATGQGRLENRSTAERVASWRDGFDSFASHPLRGVGAGQLNTKFCVAKAISAEPAHLVPLQIAVELGVTGLALAIAAWWLVFLRARKEATALAVSLALSVVALFDHYLWTLWAGNLLLAFGIAYLQALGAVSEG